MAKPVVLTHLAHVPAFVPPKARLPNSTRPADCEGLPELDGAVAAANELPRRNPVAVLDAAHVKSECIKAAEATLPPTELDEVRRTWRSNGRLLSWAHMAVAKGTNIELHCHPNVEVVYVISGALSEDRLKRTEEPENDRFLEGCAAVLDADLSQTTKDDFETRTHRAGSAFANEIGSVHRSYTDEGCELLVLWGGCHARVSKPPPFMVEGVREFAPVEAFRRDCSDWIMNALADAGCTNVYGGHGGALVPLVNAVCANPRLNWICVRNEANASLMAAAEAKLTGRLACCIATSGPGATNLTTGLVEAVQDRLPVVCLTGLKPRQSLHFAEFQDVDQSRLFAGGGVSFSVDVASPESLIPLLRDAVSTAVTRRTCVHLAIPVDVQAALAPLPFKRFCAAAAQERVMRRWGPDSEAVAKVATLVRATPRVVIALGAKAALCDGASFARLARLAHAPILYRLDAKGLVDEHDPLAFGVVGVHGKPGLEHAAALVATAELVLAFGVEDHSLLLCNNAGFQIHKMVEFEETALDVKGRFRAVETVVGDLATAAEKLADHLETTKRVQVVRRQSTSSEKAIGVDHTTRQVSDRTLELANRLWDEIPKLVKAGRRSKPRYTVDLMAPVQQKPVDPDAPLVTPKLGKKVMSVHMQMAATGRPHPATALESLSKALSDEHPRPVLCIDTGDITLWASLCYPHFGRTLSSERLGTMGYGLCAGIAALQTLPAPQRAVVVVGDGGFQMTLQELATFKQHCRPGQRLLVIVFDNALLGRVIFGFQGAAGCEIDGPDCVALAKAYGGDGIRVEKAGELPAAIDAAVASTSGLFLLHVLIDPLLKADMAAFIDKAAMNCG